VDPVLCNNDFKYRGRFQRRVFNDLALSFCRLVKNVYLMINITDFEVINYKNVQQIFLRRFCNFFQNFDHKKRPTGQAFFQNFYCEFNSHAPLISHRVLRHLAYHEIRNVPENHEQAEKSCKWRREEGPFGKTT